MSNIRRCAEAPGADAARHGINGAVQGRSADISVRYIEIPARPL